MTNHLANESSPYLKMHAQNPVDWYPWGLEALQKAASENKPILLSVGYTACHWCHVMAHESFEDKETAELMNDYFVNIKVDREERPDLDKIYQLSAQLLTRKAGGWPLTVFLMPGTEIPFFAGTYFPLHRRGNFPSFKEVLHYVHQIFHEHKQELEQQNSSFQNVFRELESQSKVKSGHLNPSILGEAKKRLEEEYDPLNGGFSGAPKFPMTTLLQYLFLYSCADDNKSTQMLIHTLKKMFHSGLYDQVGGAFFRYSVDEKWQIPHFEKMLYDNSLLLALFAHVHMTQPDHFLISAIRGTSDFLIREMQSPQGGFYATLSADTEGEEGKYYIWAKEDIKSLLTKEEFELITLYYGLNEHPNFEKSWHLNTKYSVEELSAKLNQAPEDMETKLNAINQKLFQERVKRVYPERDEKIIVSWNGLAIKAMALAGQALNDTRYIESAERSLDFIIKKLMKDDRLHSLYKDGKTYQIANLDDYAFLIEGIFYLLSVKWNTGHYLFLNRLIQDVLANFEDKEAGGFNFTANDHEKLIYRIKQYTDESVPSGNAILTKMLLYVGYLNGDEALLQAAEHSLKNAFPHITQYPDSFCSFLIALSLYFNPPEISIVRGEQTHLADWQQLFLAEFRPNRVGFFIHKSEDLPPPLDLKTPEGDIIAYLCQGSVCLPPFETRQDFLNELRSNKFRVEG